jgi:hypothetical protein
MTIAEFEVVVLEDGDVGLQRVGADDLLVRVKFSSGVKEYLEEQHIEVAKRMIDTGINAVFELKQSVALGVDSESHSTVH